MEEGVWKKEVGKNTSAKDLGPCYRIKRGVHTKKGKGVLIVKGGKGRSIGICKGSVEERIHLTFQVSPVHFIAKKNSTWRMVQNYQHINQ